MRIVPKQKKKMKSAPLLQEKLLEEFWLRRFVVLELELSTPEEHERSFFSTMPVTTRKLTETDCRLNYCGCLKNKHSARQSVHNAI